MMTLGAEKFGYIGFALAVNQYLMLLVDFGFNFTATKKIALAKGDKNQISHHFTTTLWAKIILMLLGFLLLIFVALIPQFAVYRTTMVILFAMVISNVFTFTWLFQGLGKIRIISIISCITKLAILPLTFVLVRQPNDYLLAVNIQASVYLATAFIATIFIATKGYVRFVKIRWISIFSELKESFPLFISQAASSIYVMLFVVILAYFTTPDEVGRYTAAEKIMRIACFTFFAPITQAFFPLVSKMSAQNRTEGFILTKKLLVFTTLLMTIVFVGLFFFTEPIFTLFGKDYTGIGIIAKILAIVPLFISFGGICSQLGLIALGNERTKYLYRNVYIVAAILSLVLVFVLVPLWHAVGAAWALLITELIVCGGMSWIFANMK